MADNHSPYDPDPRQGSQAGGNTRTQNLQSQIDDTVGVMKKNVDLVLERGDKLKDLRDKSDDLATTAQGFRRGANRVRKQMWWKDMKMRMCLIAGVIILILIIVIPIVVTRT